MSTTQWIQLVAAVVGLLVSIYLSVIKLTDNTAVCLPGVGNCAAVNNSPYSEILGIPVAILGSLAYFVIIVILLGEFFFSQNQNTNLLATVVPFGLFGLTLTGFIYSAYLTYLEIFIIHAICPFCVVSAITMSILFVFATLRVLADNGEKDLSAGGI